MSLRPINSKPNDRLSAVLLRSAIGNLEFSIVSNNCWGAHIYRALAMPYLTPFVGLFIPPKCYINLIQSFREAIHYGLSFTPISKFDSLNSWRERERLTYPIGLLGEAIEIHFLHYSSREDAYSKWRRRCARLVTDPGRLFFKFDDRDGALNDDIEAFYRISSVNKVCFTATKCAAPTVIAPTEPGTRHVIDGLLLAQISHKYFNTLRWLSTRPTWLPLPSLL